MDKDSTEQKTWQVCSFGKINVFGLDLNESREGFCRKGRGRSFHVDGPKPEKAREPTVESLGARNLEAESVRSGAESTGGRVKLKTATGIRRSSARDTFIAENVYLVLNSLLDWRPVQKLKQRCDVVSFRPSTPPPPTHTPYHPVNAIMYSFNHQSIRKSISQPK